jgi:hypothetical protein
MPTKLTPEIIAAAILGFEEQKRHIDSQINQLKATLGGGPKPTAPMPEASTRKRKKFSAAIRRKMAQSQKLRWARIRGESEPPAPAKAPEAKRRISEEGMKRIIAATKKRWRIAKAAKAQSTQAKKAVTKKTAGNKPRNALAKVSAPLVAAEAVTQ